MAIRQFEIPQSSASVDALSTKKRIERGRATLTCSVSLSTVQPVDVLSLLAIPDESDNGPLIVDPGNVQPWTHLHDDEGTPLSLGVKDLRFMTVFTGHRLRLEYSAAGRLADGRMYAAMLKKFSAQPWIERSVLLRFTAEVARLDQVQLPFLAGALTSDFVHVKVNGPQRTLVFSSDEGQDAAPDQPAKGGK